MVSLCDATAMVVVTVEGNPQPAAQKEGMCLHIAGGSVLIVRCAHVPAAKKWWDKAKDAGTRASNWHKLKSGCDCIIILHVLHRLHQSAVSPVRL